ncbi:hypothetical protein P692DRAFT_20345312 [Suillus brevipes Sb2]|nr:hypothetical protein P692DRAFT_20345312 [Suillus brevipes Sb2]
MQGLSNDLPVAMRSLQVFFLHHPDCSTVFIVALFFSSRVSCAIHLKIHFLLESISCLPVSPTWYHRDLKY